MPYQTNILSFDEMRRISYAPRTAAGGETDDAAPRYIPSRNDVYESFDLIAPMPVYRSSFEQQGAGRAGASSAGSFSQPADDYPAIEVYWSDAAVAARERDRARQAHRDESAASAPESAAAPAPSRLAGLKRAVAKRSAQRKYEKQFGKGDAPSTAAPAGPRAAVYKGQMGAKQRQASRMMEQDAAEPSRRRSKGTSPWMRVAACVAVVACLALSCAYLYPTAQTYYQTLRANDQLEAEYEAIAARNAELAAEVELLQTDSGIEQAAREELGWVMDGEVLATVVGLSSTDDDDEDDGEDEAVVSTYISSGSVEMPETWYSPILDVIFGVE